MVLLSCIPTVIFVQIYFTIYFWGKAFVKNYIFVNLKFKNYELFKQYTNDLIYLFH